MNERIAQIAKTFADLSAELLALVGAEVPKPKPSLPVGVRLPWVCTQEHRELALPFVDIEGPDPGEVDVTLVVQPPPEQRDPRVDCRLLMIGDRSQIHVESDRRGNFRFFHGPLAVNGKLEWPGTPIEPIRSEEEGNGTLTLKCRMELVRPETATILPVVLGELRQVKREAVRTISPPFGWTFIDYKIEPVP